MRTIQCSIRRDTSRRRSTAFATTPQPPAEMADGVAGADAEAAEYPYKLYQDWTAGRLPRMLIVLTQDANPFYDDSYAVNSANVGPYGDALTQELYPYVEKQFRGIGEPWARTVYGGSTGGWRALALQVLYPDFFNGAWVFCPDPIDFNAYAMVNLYKDDNAFLAKSQWKRVADSHDARWRAAPSPRIWTTRCASSWCWARAGARRSSSISGRRFTVRWARMDIRR